MTHVGFKYYIGWHTEYTNPPDGSPRIKAFMYESIEQRKARRAKGEPPIPVWFQSLHQLGDGYSLNVQAICTPSKMLPQKSLASIRHKRLTRRVNAKYPLLAEQMISEAIMLNKDYYDGITDPVRLADHQKAITREIEIYQEYLKYIEANP